MPVRVSPGEAATRWVQQLSAAGPKIQAGVERVTVSPGVKAAQSSQKWVAAMSDPKTHAKYKHNVGRLDLQTWKELMVNVGIPRIAQGAQAKQSKYLAFAESFFPFLQRITAQVDAMGSATFAERVNRAVQFMTLAHAYTPGQ